ncbi:hypothetical protein, partial [Paenibacillus contaminans]|uniref:hypothetical protein n=1 Tax=Paenibacillus contaminans TaxID=450362 RepID=UPI001EE0D691
HELSASSIGYNGETFGLAGLSFMSRTLPLLVSVIPRLFSRGHAFLLFAQRFYSFANIRMVIKVGFRDAQLCGNAILLASRFTLEKTKTSISITCY